MVIHEVLDANTKEWGVFNQVGLIPNKTVRMWLFYKRSLTTCNGKYSSEGRECGPLWDHTIKTKPTKCRYLCYKNPNTDEWTCALVVWV